MVTAVACVATLATGCRSSSVHPVEIATLPAQITTAAPPPVKTARGSIPALATAMRSDAKGSWARAFPRAKSFREVAAPAQSDVILTWRVGKQHKAKELDPPEDYPGNYIQPVDLVVGDGSGGTTIALGELPGSVERFGATYCRGRGFRPPSNEGDWRFPTEPSIASAFALGVVQGDDEFLMVRDDNVVHLLHRETSDGKCDEMKQGPLDGCEGFEYQRVAEIRVLRGASLYEIVTDEGQPLDCSAPTYYGAALLPPR